MSTAPWWEGHPQANIALIEAEFLKNKAEFIIAMRGAVTWSEYDNMTQDEINACIGALNKAAKAANK